MSGKLSLDHFPEFFNALTGHEPFHWQTRLMDTVATSGWPETLDLPTASGKTACLEIAVFHLALDAEAGAERTAPRRIFFVVDRRIVVDQAYDRAGAIARKLARPNGSAVLEEVAERLRALAGSGAAPLGHERLRGGMRRENVWTRSPAQPAIITATVDQVGSRLLFRSYDSSPYSAPVEAGLVGNDALILLDEAHCAIPFQQTTRAVARYRAWAETPLPTPWTVVSLSATPADPGEAEAFRLTAEERDDPELHERINTSKPAALVVARKAKVPRGGGPAEMRTARSELANRIAEQVLAFHGAQRPARTAVIVNRVATAVEVRDLLREGLDAEPVELVLMTGRLRATDRNDLVARWSSRLQAGRPPMDEHPIVVVSTQSLEVGADFDFDLLVTEAASLDALRQRFGRVDRLGKASGARGAVIIAAYQEKDSEDDPVYGRALSQTWDALLGVADEADVPADWPGVKTNEFLGAVDFGIDAMDRALAGCDTGELRAGATAAPTLLPAHLDRYVQTAPIPVPSPEPAFFLHGSEPSQPEVGVLWRMDLGETLKDGSDHVLEDTLKLCPPSAVEAVPSSLGWIRSWLRTAAEGIPETETDVEGASVDQNPDAQRETETRRLAIWRRGEAFWTDDPSRIQAGDLVVVPGGDLGPFEPLLRWEQGRPVVVDHGDRAQWEARGRATLRLHPSLIDSWPVSVVGEELARDARSLVHRPFEALSPDEARDLLMRLSDGIDPDMADRQGWRWLVGAAEHLASEPFDIAPYPSAGEVPAGIMITAGEVATATDPLVRAALEDVGDEDASDRRSRGGTVALEDHLEHVATLVEQFAERCGLSPDLTEALKTAARLHDVGKADPRFQALLYGDGLRADDRPVLAKSSGFPQDRRAYERLRELSEVPRGFRHELVSTRMAERSLANASTGFRDLILHLIASHHGRCRPFAPVVVDEAPVQVRFDTNGIALEVESRTGLHRLDSGSADRFWRLVEVFGWWGLAYLEAVLRAGDRLASAAEAADRVDTLVESAK